MLHVAAYKGILQNLDSLHQHSDSQFIKYFFSLQPYVVK